jgi:hypothetical protein
MSESEIQVGVNRPRLLEADAAPPPLQEGAPAEPLEALGPYWTADKAARVMAQGGKALSKLYGPDFRLSAVEVDLVGQPLANVLNDWVALPAGEQGDKLANLLALLAVVALLVAFRLPDILEAHDMLPGWAWSARQRAARPRPRQREEQGAELERGPELARPPAPPPEPEAPAPAASARDWNRFGPTLVGDGHRTAEAS